MKKFLLIYFFLLSMMYQNGFAQTTNAEAIQSNKPDIQYPQMTVSEYQQLSISQQKMISQQWSLTETNYSQYLQLMENTPNGLYYADKHLDPSWILGFNAKNDDERKKFALIAIKNERARIDKELAFQRIFTQLQKEVYPNDLPIQYDFSTNDKNPNALKNVVNLFLNSGKVSR